MKLEHNGNTDCYVSTDSWIVKTNRNKSISSSQKEEEEEEEEEEEVEEEEEEEEEEKWVWNGYVKFSLFWNVVTGFGGWWVSSSDV